MAENRKHHIQDKTETIMGKTQCPAIEMNANRNRGRIVLYCRTQVFNNSRSLCLMPYAYQFLCSSGYAIRV